MLFHAVPPFYSFHLFQLTRGAPSIEAMQDVLDAIRLLERKLWYTGRTGRKK
jgi:hypothetical protein